MSINTETEQELNAMLDDGVSIRLDDLDEGIYQLRIEVEDQACADCLVPDAVLTQIAADALQRRGVDVASVSVVHPT